jgi:DNA-binding response OmpR family regulator
MAMNSDGADAPGAGQPVASLDDVERRSGFSLVTAPAAMRRNGALGNLYSPDFWTISLGTGVFDPVHRLLLFRDRKLHLSPRESDVLFHLASKGGVPCSLQELAAEVWGDGCKAEPSACRQLLRGLRAKLIQFGAGVNLITVLGVGYTLGATRPGADAEKASLY